MKACFVTGKSAISSHIEIVCTACSTRFHETLARLKTTNLVQCPSCNTQISVRRYKAQAGATALFEKLTGLVGGTKGS